MAFQVQTFKAGKLSPHSIAWLTLPSSAMLRSLHSTYPVLIEAATLHCGSFEPLKQFQQCACRSQQWFGSDVLLLKLLLGSCVSFWTGCWILRVHPRVMKSEEKHKLGDINVDSHGPFRVNAIDLKQDYQESNAFKVTATEFEQNFPANHKVILQHISTKTCVLMQHQPWNTVLNWTPHSTYQENSPWWYQCTATIYIASSANAIEEAFKELYKPSRYHPEL